MPGYNKIAERYMAMWNIAADASRREEVDGLYAEDAVYVFFNYDPFVGRDSIFKHVTVSHRIYGRSGFFFSSCHNAIGHHNLMRFNWVMVSKRTGEMAMMGNDVLVLDEEDRIKADYQFHERMTPLPYVDLPPLEELLGDVLDDADLARYREGLRIDPDGRSNGARAEAAWSPLR